MRVSSFKSEAWVLNQKQVELFPPVRGSLCFKVEEFNLGYLFIKNEAGDGAFPVKMDCKLKLFCALMDQNLFLENMEVF